MKLSYHLFWAFSLLGLLCVHSCQQKEQKVLIETEFGNITAVLYNSTPKHRDNFIKLVKDDFYNDLLFHRVIKNFMIQGGDPNSKNAAANVNLGAGDLGYLIDAEIGAPHIRGTLAAARTGGPGNPDKKSSSCQFYIIQGQLQNDSQLNTFEKSKNIKYNDVQRKLYTTIGGRPDLDAEYSVFGEIIEGLEVVDKIANVETGRGNRPTTNVTMKITLL